MDWTNLTTDPCDASVKKQMHQYLQSIRQSVRTDYMQWLLQRVKGRSCLDIGAVEHDLSYTERPSWKHKQLKEVCTELTGVDILPETVNELNKRGYDIRLCDATSDTHLGKNFDVIVIGDVIEHVSNPIDLIRFAERHLIAKGEIIVKTPNPYYIDNIKRAISNEVFVNFEHIAWHTPTMALEIGRRSGCDLSNYVVFPRKRPWSSIFSQSDLFTRDFVYIYTKIKL